MPKPAHSPKQLDLFSVKQPDLPSPTVAPALPVLTSGAPAAPMETSESTTLSRDEKAWIRERFKILIHEANGNAFEQLFTSVMNYAHEGFRQIKPQGPIGDRGNDGYIPSLGRYYQVYAPEDPATSTADAIKKAKEDFQTLKDKGPWSEIAPLREYYFVFNDKYRGSSPTLEDTLSSLKQEYGLENAQVYLAKDLENELFKLSDDKILAIVKHIPNPALMPGIDFSALNEVIRHLLNSLPAVRPAAESLEVPDFEDKIKFNHLRGLQADWLNTAGLHIGHIEDYFHNNSEFHRNDIKNVFALYYWDACARISKPASAERSAEIFNEVLHRATPTGASAHIQNTVLALMAFYFESCDIFEEPPAGKA